MAAYSSMMQNPLEIFEILLEQRGYQLIQRPALCRSSTLGWYDVLYLDVMKDGKLVATYSDVALKLFHPEGLIKDLEGETNATKTTKA